MKKIIYLLIAIAILSCSKTEQLEEFSLNETEINTKGSFMDLGNNRNVIQIKFSSNTDEQTRVLLRHKYFSDCQEPFTIENDFYQITLFEENPFQELIEYWEIIGCNNDRPERPTGEIDEEEEIDVIYWGG